MYLENIGIKIANWVFVLGLRTEDFNIPFDFPSSELFGFL